MRIIAGTKRGMKLFSPKGEQSRPITDRVKESLFNVLRKYDLPEGKIVADLFSGVGSLGLEALSRGAEFVTFVEQDPKIITVLKKNIEKAGFVKESKVIRADAFKFGTEDKDFRVSIADCRLMEVNRKSAIGNRQLVYDLIFVDPPYVNTKDAGLDSPLGRLLSFVPEQLAENGIVVVRTERKTELLNQYGQLEIIERRPWGTMAVTILRKK
jgi:16S rRNA (guanine(966)-N(2))-methyltransferase RsmD